MTRWTAVHASICVLCYYRCHLPSGKVLWLCPEHQKLPRVTVLQDSNMDTESGTQSTSSEAAKAVSENDVKPELPEVTLLRELQKLGDKEAKQPELEDEQTKSNLGATLVRRTGNKHCCFPKHENLPSFLLCCSHEHDSVMLYCLLSFSGDKLKDADRKNGKEVKVVPTLKPTPEDLKESQDKARKMNELLEAHLASKEQCPLSVAQEQKLKIIQQTTAQNMAANGTDIRNSKACTILWYLILQLLVPSPLKYNNVRDSLL